MEVHHISHGSGDINKEPHVMAIGFFDGIHLGHQRLLKRAKLLAKHKNVLFTALTFAPHPDEIIKGDKSRKYITPLSEKVEKMERLGVEKLFVVQFDKTFASLSPLNFIKKYIIETNTNHVVVGFDFTFGFKAQGDIRLLRKESKNKQFGLTVIPKKTYLNEKISSTKLKKLISNGEVDMVPYYLGENYQVKVKISNITKLGKCSFESIDKYMLPKPGIYEVEISDETTLFYGKCEIRSLFDSVSSKIVATGLNVYPQKEMSLKFLNRIPEKSIISI